MQEGKNELIETIGIKKEGAKIEIDLDVMKRFFETIRQGTEVKVQEITKEVKEGKLDLKESVGIKVDESKIEIDLERSKSFIEKIGKQIEGFLSELEKELKEFGKK